MVEVSCKNCPSIKDCPMRSVHYPNKLNYSDLQKCVEKQMNIIRDDDGRIKQFGTVTDFHIEKVDSLDGMELEKFFDVAVVNYGNDLIFNEIGFYMDLYIRNIPLSYYLTVLVKDEDSHHIVAAIDSVPRGERCNMRLGMTADKLILEVPNQMILEGFKVNVRRAREEYIERLKEYMNFKFELDFKKDIEKGFQVLKC